MTGRFCTGCACNHAPKGGCKGCGCTCKKNARGYCVCCGTK